MFKNPEEYAKQMLDLYYGDMDNALAELFNGPRNYPHTPNIFWRDVAKEIIRQSMHAEIAADTATR